MRRGDFAASRDERHAPTWLTDNFRSYAGRGGHALTDWELYLPESWTDAPRCRAAGIPGTVKFATKLALAAR